MALPSVLLHDHLDGGLRAETLIDLARQYGHELPADDPETLTAHLDQRSSGSLESYLAAFTHTVAVMQTAEALIRVAREAAEDVAGDGTVYAEFRFAPLLHVREGLSPPAVTEAVLEGLSAGAGDRLRWGLILDAMRDHPDSETVARLVVRYMGDGVVGFDLAGPERGFPPDAHLPAIRIVREYGLGVTLHAGESAGLLSLAAAANRCGADRIGHGVEIVADCTVTDGEITGTGPIGQRLRDARIPLEVCPTSNLATKRWEVWEHPVGMLHRAGFRVTLNTDNRLLSATCMSSEFALVQEHHGFTLDDLAGVTRNALEAAFCPESLRRSLWEERIAPAYLEAGARQITASW